MKGSYRVISLFTGIGGMDIGFTKRVVVQRNSVLNSDWIYKSVNESNNFVELTKCGFRMVYQNDISKESKKVYTSYNRIGRSSTYSTSDIRKLVQENYIFPKADVVIAGGVPCQELCRNETRYEGSLYEACVQAIHRVKPKVFVTDNVSGLGDNKDVLECVIRQLAAGDLYDVEFQTIDCIDYGIPQTRKRIIIMGILKNGRRPDVALARDWHLITDNRVRIDIDSYWEHLVDSLVSNDLSHRKTRLGVEKDGMIIDRKNLPTVVPDKVLICKKRNRRLTLREMGLMQTFDPSFVFIRRVSEARLAHEQIGNAVPPLWGYIVARKVREVLNTYF